MGQGSTHSTEEVVARCLRAAEEVDALAARVRGLPPPTWRGPAAEELGAGVRRAAAWLDDGGAALERSGAVARQAGDR